MAQVFALLAVTPAEVRLIGGATAQTLDAGVE
jgi:hypothetical protein